MTSEVVTGENKSWTETPPPSPPLRHAIGEVVESQTWLDKLANPIQGWLLQFFGQPGEPNRKLKDLLNGTWLGHPLHPALTDVPIGSWTATTLLDVAWLFSEDEGIARGADLTLVLGLMGAPPYRNSPFHHCLFDIPLLGLPGRRTQFCQRHRCESCCLGGWPG